MLLAGPGVSVNEVTLKLYSPVCLPDAMIIPPDPGFPF
jgi:hypothetical protein